MTIHYTQVKSAVSDRTIDVSRDDEYAHVSLRESSNHLLAVIDIDLDGINSLIAALQAARDDMPTYDTFTFEVKVPRTQAAYVNPFEVKNHLRKYVAEKTFTAKDCVKTKVVANA